jgi:NAD(P)-dependent dehydrogenase (short-subunit alcohol dehydrogenase family)
MTEQTSGRAGLLAGQVAVITGAGRGIGRADALLLARLGAAVVVNDIGADVTGDGSDSSVAGAVAGEILIAGGNAVASTGDISTPEGGQSVIDTALSAFGRVDILVHNAGSLHRGLFGDLDLEPVRKVFATHLLGAFHVGQPAWRDMRSRGYGRIVLTTSLAQFGAPELSAYSAAKAGCVSLARTLALEAAAAGLDIKVNAISPSAATRRAAYSHRADSAAAALDQGMGAGGSPDSIAAVTAFLVSPGCPVTATCVRAAGSYVSRVYTGMSPGWSPGDRPLTLDDVAAHFDEAMARPDEEELLLPASSADARRFTVARVSAAKTAG